MKSEEIREKFIEFFKKKGHKIEDPSSLISDDPSTLFTTAGMQQFKKFYLNPKEAPAAKIATIQPCFRTSDIDEVGDETHLTFFEMLGNFSFGYPKISGSYFKKEAIEMAWEFLTDKKWLGIDKERIRATFFKGDNGKGLKLDNESLEILESLKKKGLPRVSTQVYKENFWSLGTEGSPGGPTVEFYVLPLRSSEGAKGGDNVEVWNLVFNEYVFKDGKYVPSEFKGVDTGMGLERSAAVINNAENIFHTDLFDLPHKKLHEFLKQEGPVAERIILDHLKAAVFIINDGILPSNKDAGYVVRRLIRRAIVKAKQIGIDNEFTKDITLEIIKTYDGVYKFDEEKITAELEKEETKFRKLLASAIPRKNKRIHIINRIGKGSETFTEWESDKKWLEDDNKYVGSKFSKEILALGEKLKKGSIEASIAGAGASIASGLSAFRIESTYGYPHEFFFDELSETLPGKVVQEAKGVFSKAENEHRKLSRTASAGMFKGGLAGGGEMETKFHTATHLLLAALRDILGKDVNQKGANITAERIRFDFNYPEKLSDEQIKKIDGWVNDKISKNLDVKMEEMPLSKALEIGATSIPGFKYPNKVKVYSINDFSREICGGPHVENTSELGHFEIKKEESSSAGIRRIKAVLENSIIK
ncbi:MAG: alanine--tRNA ligase-related protein [Candidatus Berkelbacteria bacterium]|nr:alanine--tRNA ligase-related protein [Candidatus Berkelbacteria bacterium]